MSSMYLPGPRQPANPEQHDAQRATTWRFWQQGDIQYCAVSDTGWDELLGLVRLLKEPPPGAS